ncbi:MAG: subtilisin family serine protease [Bacteroidia bacterium]|jgi:subtilisin family serine protease
MINRIFKFFLILFILYCVDLKGQKIIHSGNQIFDATKVESNRIVVKLRGGQNSLDQNFLIDRVLNLSELGGIIEIYKVEKVKYADVKPPGKTTLANKPSILDNIFYIELDETQDLENALKTISKFSNVIYAEPLSRAELLFTPNDSNISNQYSLELIQAFEAWGITKGDESIVVGVSDTGAQLDHADLVGNLYINEADPINNIDDDANGYVDDYNGWDFADSDNDPTADQNDHGTFVAGLSSASTNNSIGIAGIGYNCKFAPLKVFRSIGGFSFNLYESIIYAADQGFDVINLSWGSAGGYSQFEQDIINYAVLEKDMVVVAAAGNTNAELDFYPASYDNVLSVANTTEEDVKAPGATYSYNVDLTAPGFGVYSTKNGNSYVSKSGSSFSSPQVAGAAALVKSVFPDLTAIQIMEQVRVSADDIYCIDGNSTYNGLLGKGRLNVFEAVSKDNLKSIRINDFSHFNSFGKYVFYDDTVTVVLDFFNYLNPTTNAKATLSSSNPHLTFIDNEISLGSFNELEQSNLFETQIVISEEAQHDERLIIRLDYSDVDYQDFEYLDFEVSPDNLDFSNPKLSMNISRNGDLVYPTNNLAKSDGLLFNEKSVGEFIGIMIGNHPDSISDNVLSDFFVFSREQDFKPLDKIKFHHVGNVDKYTKSSFDDSNAGSRSLSLIIEQEVLAWDDELNSEFIILEYRVTNDSEDPKSDLNVSFFADWDLEERLNNKSSWDEVNKLAYSYSHTESEYIGMAILTDQGANVHSIDLANENGNTAEMSTAFSDELKHSFMTTEKINAGEQGLGNNVAQVLSGIIGGLNAYESEKVTFVITGASSLEGLQENVLKAKLKYKEFVENPPITNSIKVCNDLPFFLKIDSGSDFEIFENPYMDKLLATGNNFEFGGLKEDSLLFVRNIDKGYASDIFRFKIDVDNPHTNFSIDPDTLYLGDNNINKVVFYDLSEEASSWEWSFGNGSFSNVQHPKVIYNESGIYEIELVLKTEKGCSGSLIRNLVVAQRSPEPIIENKIVCRGEPVTLSATNSSKLMVYKTETQEEPIFIGANFILSETDNDTTFYITSVEETFESHRIPVTVEVNDLEVDFSVVADTLDLNSKKRINFYDKSKNTTGFEWYVDDLLIGTSSQESFTITEQLALSVKLKATNSEGCLDSLTKVVELKTAAIPEIFDLTICSFDEVELNPSNGQVFYFYESPDLAIPVYKGRKFNVGKISSPTIFYVTNVDGLVESESKAVQVNIIPFQAEIVTSPDTLILSQSKNLALSFTSAQEIAEASWFVNDEFVESTFSPTLNFESTGAYDIKLVVTNDMGCKDTTNLSYFVINVPITGLNQNLTDEIDLYPNPTDGYIHLHGLESFQNLQLIHFTGQLVKYFGQEFSSKIILDVTELDDGLYILLGKYNKESFSKKVLIQNSTR